MTDEQEKSGTILSLLPQCEMARIFPVGKSSGNIFPSRFCVQLQDQFSARLLENFDVEDLFLEWHLKKGGLPFGTVVEILAPDNSTCQTLIINTLLNLQDHFVTCMLLDTCRRFEVAFASSIGLDVDAMLLCQPETLTDVFNNILMMANMENSVVVLSGMADFLLLKCTNGADRMGLISGFMDELMCKMRLQGIGRGMLFILIEDLQVRLREFVLAGTENRHKHRTQVCSYVL